ncbi:MAG: hypothetical protein AAGI71_19370 [Bacteroidota bacterium]
MWAALLGLLAGGPLQAQPVVLQAAEAQVVARIDAGQSVAIDVQQRLYLAEGRSRQILVLDSAGTALWTLGGRGVGDGQVQDPRGLEAQDGTFVWVADAQEGVLHRFAQRGPWMTSLRLDPATFDEGSLGVPAARPRLPGEPAEDRQDAFSRPVDLCTGPTGALYALDQHTGRVAWWDARYQPVQWLEPAQGRWLDPVGVAASRDRVYVADQATQTVTVFDVFGTQTAMWADSTWTPLRALVGAPNGVWVLHETGLDYLSQGGVRQQRLVLPSSLGAAVDVAVGPRHVFVLYPDRLVRWSLDPAN